MDDETALLFNGTLDTVYPAAVNNPTPLETAAASSPDFTNAFVGTIADPALTAALDSSSPPSAPASSSLTGLFGGLDQFLSSLESAANGAAATYTVIHDATTGAPVPAAAPSAAVMPKIGGLTPTQLMLGAGLLVVAAAFFFRK